MKHCNKKRYRDKHEALKALRCITPEREKTPVRAYQCFHCKGFHLTAEKAR